MTPSVRRRRVVVLVMAVAVVAVALSSGFLGLGHASRSAGQVTVPARPKAAHTTARTPVPVTRMSGTPDANPPAPARAALPGTRPVRVQIPSIDVDSTLEPLGVDPDGALASPSAWQRAGWYAGGVRPGDTGPAVIAGHVDSTLGPAVFFRLRELRPGAHVVITDADHANLTFVVDGVQQFPKKIFPTSAVYGPSALPLLRLITCTGQFDRADRNYLDNLVVTTHLVSR